MSIHAMGRFWTTLAGPELEDALASNHIICVGKVCTYAASELFTKYIEELTALRITYLDNGNKPFAAMCKDKMVSLYGKFAQKVGTWSDVDDVSPPSMWGRWSQHYDKTKRTESFRSVNGKVQIYKRDKYADHALPAISAFVNSYAREYMIELIRKVGEDNIYYTYIDSIHCNSEGFLNLYKRGLIHKHVIGALKIEEVSHYVNYRGIGDYVFGSDDKVIGISKNAEKVDDNTYRVLDFERLDSVIDKRGVDEIGVKKIDKIVERKFSCGTILSDGFTRRLWLWNEATETSDAIEKQSQDVSDSSIP
jgi:hypothetical protein